MYIKREGIKLSFFTDGMTVYVGTLKKLGENGNKLLWQSCRMQSLCAEVNNLHISLMTS